MDRGFCLRARRAVFVGTARNCAPFIGAALANISRLAALYGTTAYVFVVGDSDDQTAAMLRGWIADGQREGRVIDQGNQKLVEARRTVRIATARNLCMDEVRRSYPNFDHLVVCDLDEVLSGAISTEAFAQAAVWLESSSTRAGVMANSRPRYFDIWALRHRTWCPDDCWHAIWDRPPRQSFEAAKYKHVFTRQVQIPSDVGPIKVDSAFGGLAIYKLAATTAAQYVGVDAGDREQAEHVAFNSSIARRGGELFVFPSLMVEAPQAHLYDSLSAHWPLRLRMLSLGIAEYCRPTWVRLKSCEARIAS